MVHALQIWAAMSFRLLVSPLALVLGVALAACGADGADSMAPGDCVATTCAEQGKTCGTIPNNCGATLTCGAPCPTSGGGDGDQCYTCGLIGAECGSHPNNCNGTIECGTCPTGSVCDPN